MLFVRTDFFARYKAKDISLCLQLWVALGLGVEGGGWKLNLHEIICNGGALSSISLATERVP